MKPIPFSKQEAALLLDAYLKTLDGTMTKNASVKVCSQMLRAMAVNSGIEIDDKYRNVSGIAFQMSSMESAYQGETIMKAPTRLFLETVRLYQEENETYQKLLSEAKAMAGTSQEPNQDQVKENEAVFLAWLSENAPSAQLSDLYLVLREIEEQAVRDRLIKNSLYESLDSAAVLRIRRGVESNRYFKNTQKKQWRTVLSAMDYLVEYAIKHQPKAPPKVPPQTPPKDPPKVPPQTPPKDPPKVPPQTPPKEPPRVPPRTPPVEPPKVTPEEPETGYRRVNFNSISSMAFTKPVSLSYFREIKPETMWSMLYADVCRCLLIDYPQVFLKLSQESMFGTGKTWLADKQHLEMLAMPKSIGGSYYVETNRSATDLVKNIQWLLTECLVDYENVIITYAEIREKPQPEQPEQPKKPQIDPKPTKPSPPNTINGEEIKIYDFKSKTTVTFAKPVSISYFGEEKTETSWRSLYIDACNWLLDDYPTVFSRLRQDSISGNNKPWLVDEQNLNLIAEPKKIRDSYYVETNQNASALMKRLKWLLDQCSVDYENVVVKYIGKDTSSKPGDRPPKPQGPGIQLREEEENFYRWMSDNQHMARETCRSYISAIRSAERFAAEHNFASNKLFTGNVDEAKATADALFDNLEFVQIDNNRHRWANAAISKLFSFYNSNWTPPAKPADHPGVTINPPKPRREVPPLDAEPYMKILVDHFPRGYRLGSPLELKRFRRFYEEQTGQELSLDQGLVEAVIRKCGVEYEGRIYMPQTMLGAEMKEKVISYISSLLEVGRSGVYYEAVYREFSDELLDHNIYNADMLKEYLTFYLSDRYYMGRNYISKTANGDIDPADEVRQCLKQYERPVSIDEVCSVLSHIAGERVRNILGSYSEFVRNGKGEYFHADALNLTDDELEEITSLISATIEEHEFISGNELYEYIQMKCPYAFEKNSAYSVIGWRDALKYKIGDRFSFVGNIISRSGAPMSMNDVYAGYSKGRPRFSIDELEQFSHNIGSTIYFDSLYTNAIRISDQWFVARNSVSFSVEKTDAVLERLCTGQYMPINEVTLFETFPEASHPWNEYLLEQYVAFYSEKFCLVHGNFNKDCVVGAIVRRTCSLRNFDDLVTDVLANSGVPLRKKEALDYLVSRKYIARRSYYNIESLLINANAIRNQKEK